MPRTASPITVDGVIGEEAWGVALDLKNDEVAVTVEHINQVEIYRREAKDKEKPLRIIQGPNTGMSDPHGIAIDAEHDELFVANHTSYHEVGTGEADPNAVSAAFARGEEAPQGVRERIDPRVSKGKFVQPSIRTYSRTAKGDVTPVRVIEGPKTRLDLPMKIVVDNVIGHRPLPSGIASLLGWLPGHSTSTGLLTLAVLATVVLFFVRWLADLAAAWANLSLDRRLTYDVGEDLFEHLQRLSLGFHAARGTGDTIRRVTTDAECVSTIVIGVMVPVATAIVTLSTVVGVMWRVQASLMPLVLLAIPPNSPCCA